MKILFDENLSPKLTKLLENEFPECKHLSDVGLKGKSDYTIWEFSKKNNFVIISKDTDFRERSYLEGAPPKIIWIDVGNCATKEIESLIRNQKSKIEKFTKQKEESFLVLSIK